MQRLEIEQHDPTLYTITTIDTGSTKSAMQTGSGDGTTKNVLRVFGWIKSNVSFQFFRALRGAFIEDKIAEVASTDKDLANLMQRVMRDK